MSLELERLNMKLREHGRKHGSFHWHLQVPPTRRASRKIDETDKANKTNNTNVTDAAAKVEIGLQ
jgi:hypothetical protein